MKKEYKGLSKEHVKELKVFKKLEKIQISKMAAKIERIKLLMDSFLKNAHSKSIDSWSELITLNNFFKFRAENLNETLGTKINFDAEELLRITELFLCKKVDGLYFGNNQRVTVDTSFAKKIYGYEKKFKSFAKVMIKMVERQEKITQYQVDELAKASFALDISLKTYEKFLWFIRLQNNIRQNPGKSVFEMNRDGEISRGYIQDEFSRWVTETKEWRFNFIDEMQKNVDIDFVKSLENLLKISEENMI